MLSIRRIIDNPEKMIPVPVELQHRRIEVIFTTLDSKHDAATQLCKPGLLKGMLDESFFEPLPEDELRVWE